VGWLPLGSGGAMESERGRGIKGDVRRRGDRGEVVAGWWSA